MPFLRKGKLLSLPLGNSKRRSSLLSTTARSPTLSVLSIFFGPPPVLPGLSLAKGPRGSLPSPQASLESKEGWPGGLPPRPVRSPGLGPLFKKGVFLPFPSFPCLPAGRGGGALLPERKVRGWGPAQAGKGWPPGRLQGGGPLKKALDLPSFLYPRKAPKVGLPGKPPGSLRAAFVAFLPELS